MSLTISPAEIVARAESSGAPGLLGKSPKWSRISLGEVAKVINGAAYPSSGFNVDGRGMPLVRIRDVGSSQLSTWFDGEWEEQHLVHRGDLLVGMDGDFRAAPWIHGDALLNQRVCRITVTDSRYDQDFLRLVLQGYLDAIWVETSAITVKHLSSRSISAIPLPLPPLEEQRRIVAILEDHLSHLDAADASLIAATNRLGAFELASLDASFGINGEWQLLDDVVEDISAGKSFGSSNAPAANNEWGIIKVSAMTWGEFRAEENKAVPADRIDPRFEIHEGDLLVSRANTADYVGASVLVGKVRPRLLLSDKSLRVAPKPEVEAKWLWRALQSPSSRQQITSLATGTKESMRNITQGSLRQIRLPVHSSEEQRHAIEQHDKLANAIAKARRQIVNQQRYSSALRRSLLAAAFSGRLTGSAGSMSVARETVGA
ncbi:MAG: restriction endonuclease subunit S [Leucobacter sp.]|nr:restriction endonuclease subunit S [Leucobacter sp.]